MGNCDHCAVRQLSPKKMPESYFLFRCYSDPKLTDATYPDENRAIPAETGVWMTASSADLRGAAELVGTVGDGKDRILTLSVHGTECRFSCQVENGNYGETHVDVAWSGPDFTAQFNLLYFVDTLGHIDGDVHIQPPTKTAPAIFRAPAVTDAVHLLMPMTKKAA